MTLPRLKIKTTPDIIAIVPYLLGFHPSDCIVVVTLRDRLVHCVLRLVLPGGDPGAVVGLIAAQGAEHAFAVGYGAAPLVTPVLPRVAAGIRLAGVEVLDEVRVTDGRYWSLTADGQPCDVGSTVVAAAATFQGLPVVPDHASLVAQLAPVTGEERAAMSAATARAETRLLKLERRSIDKVREAGFAAVRDAEERVELTDDEVAWLGLLLVIRSVHDYAWSRCEARHSDQALWTGVVRRVEPAHAAPPATLLAFVTWRLGLGALAGIAVDRALAANRHYGPAKLMDELLRRGLPPISAKDWPGRNAA